MEERHSDDSTLSLVGVPVLAAVAIAAIFAFVCILLLLPFTASRKRIHVDSKAWAYTSSVEKLKEVQESGWTLPKGAKNIKTSEEKYRYKSVYSHNRPQVIYSSGNPVIITVPVYDQKPVYKTKYTYTIMRWVHERDVTDSGTDGEPRYGKLNLSHDEREAGREQTRNRHHGEGHKWQDRRVEIGHAGQRLLQG